MKKRILVIDDDQGILEAFEAILESEGYDVVILSDTERVESLVKTYRPDLILLDILLSGADGRDICKKLKSKPRLKNIPIIMISAHPSASKTIQSVGADDFVEKPFEMDILLKKVKHYTTKQDE